LLHLAVLHAQNVRWRP